MNWNVQIYTCLSLRAAYPVKTDWVWSRHLEVYSFFSSLVKVQLMMWWTLPSREGKGGNWVVSGAHIYTCHIPLILWWKDNIVRILHMYPIFKIGMLLFFFFFMLFNIFKDQPLGETDLATPLKSLCAMDELPQCVLSAAVGQHSDM